MALVVLDTSVVMILAGLSSQEQKAKERAEDLVTHHRGKHDTVAIPSAALAECSHCDEEVWSQLVILDLNAPAALLANRLMQPLRNAAKKRVSWQCVKFDALILATAEDRGAAFLYTTDPWFESAAKAASLKVKAKGLPELTPKQTKIKYEDE